MFPDDGRGQYAVPPTPRPLTIAEVQKYKTALEKNLTTLVRDFEKQTGLEITAVFVPLFSKKNGLTVSAKLP